VAILPPEPK